MRPAARGRRGDKADLSLRPRYRETPEVAAAARRLLRAVGKRVATEDPEDLAILRTLDAELEQAWMNAITGLRQTGYSDAQIGEALGVKKQAVQQRWPR